MQEYKGMKVGDIITTYSQGYHKLVKIEPVNLPGDNVSFHFKQVADNQGKRKNSNTIKACHYSFCRPAVAMIEKSVKEMNTWIQNLEAFKKEIPTLQG